MWEKIRQFICMSKVSKVSIYINEEDLVKYMLFAHEQDITFNQLVKNSLEELIKKEKDADELLRKEGFKRVEEWQQSLYRPPSHPI